MNIKETVIDMCDYIKQEVLPRRRLDVSIAEKVFGRKIIGWARYDYDYGIIHNPDIEWIAQERETMCVDPVYVAKCQCACLDTFYSDQGSGFVDGRKFFGHYSECMAVVPRYSSDVGEALGLVSDLNDLLTFTITSRPKGYWHVSLNYHNPHLNLNYSGISSDILPYAITQVLLRAWPIPGLSIIKAGV